MIITPPQQLLVVSPTSLLLKPKEKHYGKLYYYEKAPILISNETLTKTPFGEFVEQKTNIFRDYMPIVVEPVYFPTGFFCGSKRKTTICA